MLASLKYKVETKPKPVANEKRKYSIVPKARTSAVLLTVNNAILSEITSVHDLKAYAIKRLSMDYITRDIGLCIDGLLKEVMTS